MSVTLFENENHLCIAYTDLVSGQGVQSNQFVIVHGKHKAILDPGGDLTFTPLNIKTSIKFDLDEIDYILASHQDPDIIASMGQWLMQTKAKVICPRIWVRFLPHFLPSYMDSEVTDRIIGIPDKGAVIPLGDAKLIVLPAHFLHSVGNIQFYDVTSKILFSGDMGASLTEDQELLEYPITDTQSFNAHIGKMEGFHKRYMVSRKVCNLWVNMVRNLEINMIVPQHGRAFKGREAINAFLNWISHLECGIDLMKQEHYNIPKSE